MPRRLPFSLSRTSCKATVPISDEMTRALENIIQFVLELRGDEDTIHKVISDYDSLKNRRETVRYICDSLMSGFETGDD